jgi:hypothetical protein
MLLELLTGFVLAMVGGAASLGVPPPPVPPPVPTVFSTQVRLVS